MVERRSLLHRGVTSGDEGFQPALRLGHLSQHSIGRWPGQDSHVRIFDPKPARPRNACPSHVRTAPLNQVMPGVSSANGNHGSHAAQPPLEALFCHMACRSWPQAIELFRRSATRRRRPSTARCSTVRKPTCFPSDAPQQLFARTQQAHQKGRLLSGKADSHSYICPMEQ